MQSCDNWGIIPRMVGRCIYCGRTDLKLTDEHIIPYALNGEPKLLAASCKPCAEITSRFEMKVLRGALLPLRAKAKFKCRKKSLPQVMPLDVERDGEFHSERIDIDRHPGMALVPIYPAPAHLSGVSIELGKMMVLGTRGILPDNPQKVSETLGIERFRQHAMIDDFAFAQLLAKIAYCTAIARWGYDVFDERWVLPTIFEQTYDVSRWVGCNTGARVNRGKGLHQVTSRIVANEIHVYILLFAPCAIEEYLVIVGSVIQSDNGSHNDSE